MMSPQTNWTKGALNFTNLYFLIHIFKIPRPKTQIKPTF